MLKSENTGRILSSRTNLRALARTEVRVMQLATGFLCIIGSNIHFKDEHCHGMFSKQRMALKILQIQFLKGGPLQERWRGDSWSEPPEPSFLRGNTNEMGGGAQMTL